MLSWWYRCGSQSRLDKRKERMTSVRLRKNRVFLGGEMVKKTLVSNIKIFDKIAIFETTDKSSLFLEVDELSNLQYEKNMKLF